MILCDNCNHCYHRECAARLKRTLVHDGPWFCGTCKGHLVLQGIPDVTLDRPLHAYLWVDPKTLPEDPTTSERILYLVKDYRAHGNELQVLLPATATRTAHWVDVHPLISRPQLLADTHSTLAHCGHEKMLAALREHYWWPAMHAYVVECIRRCAVCQKDRV